MKKDVVKINHSLPHTNDYDKICHYACEVIQGILGGELHTLSMEK